MRGTWDRRRQRGFTLLEALIAAAILAIGMVGIIGLQATLFRSARYSADISNASYLLQHRVEELGTRSRDALLGPPALCAGAATGCATAAGTWAAAPASGCSQRVRDPISVTAAGPATGGPYRIDTGVLPHADALDHPNALVATVSVCWTEANGRVRQLQAARVLGDR